MTTSAGDWTARHLAAGVLVLLAAALVGTGVALTRVPFTAGLWGVLAFGIGLLIGRWWALLLTFAPWPLGLALVFALGRHFYLSDTWWQGWLLLGVLPGLVGIAGGVALGRRIAALRGLKAGLALTVLAGVLLWLPFPLSAAVIRDAPAPPDLADKLDPAKRMFANQLERRVSHVRFIGVQTRATDNLVVLQFELREYPFQVVTLSGYLVSRCRPLSEIELEIMGGGVVEDGALIRTRSWSTSDRRRIVPVRIPRARRPGQRRSAWVAGERAGQSSPIGPGWRSSAGETWWRRDQEVAGRSHRG